MLFCVFWIFSLLCTKICFGFIVEGNSCVSKNPTDNTSRQSYACGQVEITINKYEPKSDLLIMFMDGIDDEIPGVLSIKNLPNLNLDVQSLGTISIELNNIQIDGGSNLGGILAAMGIPLEKVDSIFVNTFNGTSLTGLKGVEFVWKLTLVGGEFESAPSIAELFPELRNLVVIQTEIKPIFSIKGLQYLEDLALGETNLTRLGSDFFSETKRIKYLSISLPMLSIVEKDVFQNLIQLEQLSVMTIQNEFCSLENQAELRGLFFDISESPKDLPEDIFKASSLLQKISIEYSGVQTIHPDLFKVTFKLETLSLKGNLIQELPNDIFSNNLQLKNLDVSDNHLAVFSDTVLPSSIKILHLERNPLKDLFMKKELQNLEILIAIGGEIQGEFKLKAITELYPNLEILDLTNNRITKIIIEAPILLKSRDLTADFTDNRISIVDFSLDAVKFPNVSNFVHLDLSGNPLECDCQNKRFLEHVRLIHGKYVYLEKDSMCFKPKGGSVLTLDLNKLMCLK